MKKQCIGLAYLVFTIILSLLVLTSSVLGIYASQSPWPTIWIQIDWDKNEDGAQDDWRDVKYAYYNFDSSYLYLRLECYDQPGKDWPQKKGARYKWFIDFDGNLYVSGGNVIDAEYLLFVEDTDDDEVGELYLLFDQDGNGDFDEYEPWPPANYNDYKITDPTIGGWRIIGNYIDMYVSWNSLGNPSSYGLFFATDQENPNLNQAPTTDTRDEETLIIIRDVIALSQSVNATEVVQGDIVNITIIVSNRGMQSESFDVTCYFYPTIIGIERVENLPIGSNKTLIFLWNTSIVEPGTYEIRAFADSSGEILEMDEGNNWCTAEATVTVKVHDISALRQSVNATIVTQGEAVEVEVVVKNLGDFTESFNVVCYYDDIQIGSPIRVVDLEPGEERTVRFIWDTSGVDPGVYFIKAFADSSREITEYNEDNNNCTSTEYVEIIVHDIAAVSQIPYPTRVVQGESVTIEVTIRNEGTEYESFTLKCYYYNETAEIPMELGERSVSLDPGSEKIEYFIWDTTGIPPAIYYIEARAIPVEGELDTDDNTCMSQVNVTITVASISGYKWNDIDGDGEWDVAEPPLQN